MPNGRKRRRTIDIGGIPVELPNINLPELAGQWYSAANRALGQAGQVMGQAGRVLGAVRGAEQPSFEEMVETGRKLKRTAGLDIQAILDALSGRR